MNDILFSFLVVVGFFTIIIVLYRWNSGIYPASKLIITPPPITHSGLEPKQAKFMFFHTTWCPHCKTADSPWKSFQQQVKNKPVTYGDYNIIFEDIKHITKNTNGIFACERNVKDLLKKINYIMKNYDIIKKKMLKNKLPTKNFFIRQLYNILS